MLSMVLGILIFRTGNRTQEVIGNRQQRMLYNAATPAMDRANAKLEFLFKKEPLPPLPSDSDLVQALRNDGNYTLPDETRLDLDGNANTIDNAWEFQFNVDGDPNTGTDGKEVTVAYSILTQANTRDAQGNLISFGEDDAIKATAQVVRNGPINLAGGAANPNCNNLALSPRAGWQPINSSTLRKALQVNAFAKNNTTGIAATLEMQQDRQANMGNKWGAWFRYDLEVFPGPAFRWNGAMHTESNFMPTHEGGSLNLYLISSPASCVYTRDASEISVAGETPRSPFEGQIITGSMKRNATSTNSSVVHRFSESLPSPSPGKLFPQTISLTREIDSVTGTNIKPGEIAVDPILLFTEDRNRSRDSSDPYNHSARDSNWENRPLAKDHRVYNDPQNKPFVDDTYRADDRWGPKAEYTSSFVMNEDTDNDGIADADEDQNADGTLDVYRTGDRITSAYSNSTELIRNEASANSETEYGYDGYWERRAKAQGVRLIVSQRLELGNANGWKGADDPLNPPPANAAQNSVFDDTTNDDNDRFHEQRQWRSLRDNLAAVQTTAVYHYLNDGGDYPVACLASTAHTGTDNSRTQSRQFDELPGVASRIDTNFLTGKGTNGIEFSAPFSSSADPEAAFATAINNTDSSLRRALTNLARFAGDPAGGFPSQQDTVAASKDNAAYKFAHFAEADAKGVVHPYPQLTAWGDFSNLRRIMTYLENDSLDGGEIDEYDALSPADKSTLHTATCTLGALAYNLQNQEEMYQAAINGSGPSLQAVGEQLFKLMDGKANNGNAEIGNNSDNRCTSFNGSNGCPSQNPYTVSNINDLQNYRKYYAQFTPEDWVKALRSDGQNNHADKLELMIRAYQIRRDRALGFVKDKGIPGNGTGYDWGNGLYDLNDGPGLGNVITGIAESLVIYEGIGCDPSSFGLSEKAEVGLAMALCPSTSPPKYPSLYYLFPLTEHAPDGQISTTAQAAGASAIPQPSSEPYVSATNHPYLFDRANKRGINCYPNAAGTCQNTTFRPLGDTDNNGIENGTEDGVTALANALGMAPRTTTASWKTPVTATATGRINQITVQGTNLYPAFLDKGFFNGREMMAVRALDLDLDLMRRTSITGINRIANPSGATTDYWLPLPDLTASNDPTRAGAMVYAFREDAIREDGIARPRQTSDSYSTWLSKWLKFVNNPKDATVANYIMNAVGAEPTDPPVNPRTGISPKAVDFYADPDRRPFGFRLRNGQDLRRVNGSTTVSGTSTAPELRGFSFVSDNPVYLQADNNEFNWHTQEEFTETLSAENWDNFYDRKTLNTDFASRNDRWRPAEIIADAVTLLSASFTEGTIARGIRDNSPGSFAGLSHGNDTNLPWVRENGVASSSETYSSPIKISQRGFPVYCVESNGSLTGSGNACSGTRKEIEYGREASLLGGSNRTYKGINGTSSSGGTPDETYINAVIVSGIVPSRGGQSFGGLHNFPRFVEGWKKLFISGSLMQLNFSSYATGPFDKDSWEPGLPPDANNELISYYGPPNRFWGYDVALQYAPAGPISERFITRSDLRSEFYRELPVEDPYILNLRCATPEGSNNKVDPDAADCN